jgi:hypothetical protein
MQLKLFCTTILITACCIGTALHLTEGNAVFPVQKMQNDFSDTVHIYSHTTKRDYVKLYPNPTSTGTVTIHSNTNEVLDFYVFDLEGTLLYRIELKGREEKTIKKLKKGSYAYDVFKDDESIEQGKIIVK